MGVPSQFPILGAFREEVFDYCIGVTYENSILRFNNCTKSIRTWADST
ncbi:hypothetical protein WN943_005213 [Citrus x changshan-huyou]